MRKRIYTLMALVATTGIMAHADEPQVVVTMLDGATEEIPLDEVGHFYFEGDNLFATTLSTEGQKTLSWMLANVLSIRFRNTTDGIGAVKEGSALKLLFDGSTLRAEGLKSGQRAAIYAVGGQQVLSMPSWDGSPISTESLPKGVYVFRVGNQSIKFIR